MFTNLAQSIPAKYRKVVYATIGTIAAVELTLDVFGYGLIPTEPQAAILAVLATLGFGIAVPNTNVKPGPEA